MSTALRADIRALLEGRMALSDFIRRHRRSKLVAAIRKGGPAEVLYFHLSRKEHHHD